MSNTEREESIRNRFWRHILSIVACEIQPRFYGSYLHEADCKPFEEQRIFVRDTPKRTFHCEQCCSESPVKKHRTVDGKVRYWLMCCLPVTRVNPKHLRAWFIEPEVIFRQFRDVAGIIGTATEIIPDTAWKWGRCGQQSFVYVQRVTEDDLKQVAAVLKRFPESIFITPRTCYLETLDIVLPNRGIAFDEVSSLDENYQIRWDLEKINAMIEPEVKQKIEPVSRRGSREAKITRLVEELKLHYKTAKDHFIRTEEVLPRPSQTELANRTGISQNVISRCLQDKNAVVLRTLWDNAENIRAVMNS